MQKQKIAKTVSIRQQGDDSADDEEDDDDEDPAEAAEVKAAAKKPPRSGPKKAPGKTVAKVDKGAAAKAAALRKAMPVDMADDEEAEDGDDFEVRAWSLRCAPDSKVITINYCNDQQKLHWSDIISCDQ